MSHPPIDGADCRAESSGVDAAGGGVRGFVMALTRSVAAKKSLLFLSKRPQVRAVRSFAPQEGKHVMGGTQHGAALLGGPRGVAAARFAGQMASGAVLFGVYGGVLRAFERGPAGPPPQRGRPRECRASSGGNTAMETARRERTMDGRTLDYELECSGRFCMRG